jgi:hypothetical protein
MYCGLQCADLVQVCNPDGVTARDVWFKTWVLLKLGEMITLLVANVRQHMRLINTSWPGRHRGMGFPYL